MTAVWIASGVVVLAVVAVVVFDALRRPGDQRDPEQPSNIERLRPQSKAAMAAPVSDADEQAAAELVSFVEEVSTGGFPSLAFDADPLGAPIPDGHVVEAETFFNDLAADRLSAFTWTAAARETVALSSVPVPHVPEVDPFALEGPTGVFGRDWMAQVMAKAEAR